MKKIFVILLSFAAMLSLAACTSNSGEVDGANDKEDDIQVESHANDVQDESPNIQIVSPIGGMGDGESIVEIGPNAGFVDKSSEFAKTFPIYVNDYAYGHEGPLYEVTDAVRDAISINLARYLECLYGEFDAQETEFLSKVDREFEVCYLSGSTEIRSTMNRIAVLSGDYSIPSDITDAELLNHPLVTASIAYLGLNDPVVTQTIEYALDGTEALRSYKIAESADDAFQQILNRSFFSITVEKYADSRNVLVSVDNPVTLAKHSDYPAPSYSSILAKLTDCYPNMDTQNVEAEIYYSKTVHPGYFVPCCRFYIKDGITTQSADTRCTVVDVVLLDSPADD